MAYFHCVVGSGGGGDTPAWNDAIVRIIAPPGSVVTLTKGSDSKTLTGTFEEGVGTHYSAVIHNAEFGTWTYTVTYTQSGTTDTRTGTMSILTNALYGFNLCYAVNCTLGSSSFLGSPVTFTKSGAPGMSVTPTTTTVYFYALVSANGTGTWTISGTASGSTYTTSVTTIDGTYAYTAILNVFSATIAVTYPSGSTCTCYDGTTTLTDPGTTGSYTFTVPNSGTWTVSCTDGSSTATDTVTITTSGQSETVTLAYTLYLIRNGQLQVNFSSTNFVTNSATPYTALRLTQNADNYYVWLTQDSSNWCSASFEVNDFISSTYTTLNIDAMFYSDASEHFRYVYAFATRPTYVESATCKVVPTEGSRVTTTLDISSFVGQNIKVGCNLARNGTNGSSTINIYNMWLS